MKQDKMFGQKVDIFTFINRIHVLEGIIFDLKEVLKYYSNTTPLDEDWGTKARNTLAKYNKTFDEIYTEADKKLKKIKHSKPPWD